MGIGVGRPPLPGRGAERRAANCTLRAGLGRRTLRPGREVPVRPLNPLARIALAMATAVRWNGADVAGAPYAPCG